MSSQLRRNGDGILTDCLCFGACCFPCPSISLLLAMFAMHHLSLSLSLSLSPPLYLLLPWLIISRRDGGDGQTSRLPAKEENLYENTALVISVRAVWSSAAPHKETTQLARFPPPSFNSPALSCSVYITLRRPPSPSVPPSSCHCVPCQTCLISRFYQK